jgi:hypothetical protein
MLLAAFETLAMLGAAERHGATANSRQNMSDCLRTRVICWQSIGRVRPVCKTGDGKCGRGVLMGIGNLCPPRALHRRVATYAQQLMSDPASSGGAHLMDEGSARPLGKTVQLAAGCAEG